MRLYRQTIEEFSLYSGMELTEEEMTRLETSAGKMSAKMRAVRIVSASNVSTADLQSRLIQKGEDVVPAKEAVAWMSEMGLLDDKKTAETIVSRCAAKGYGIARAKQALYEKRIPKEYWGEALADYPDQSENIRAFLISRITSSDDGKALRKVIDALIRRGHSYADIRKVLNTLDLQDSHWWE